MRHSDRTAMGGPQSRFQTTRWEDLRALQGMNAIGRQEAFDKLLRQYWKPVYCYLRRKGYANEAAKDLTQGFFQETVLGKELAQQASQEKGRFRTLLLTALDRYVASAHRRESAKKRRPDKGLVSLDVLDDNRALGPVDTMQPEDAFSYVWASLLVQQAIDQTQQQCWKDGKKIHWKLFEARVLGPILADREPVALQELCRQLDLANPTKAENMIVTVRRRFKKTVLRLIRECVHSDREAEEELNDLLGFLEK